MEPTAGGLVREIRIRPIPTDAEEALVRLAAERRFEAFTGGIGSWGDWARATTPTAEPRPPRTGTPPAAARAATRQLRFEDLPPLPQGGESSRMELREPAEAPPAAAPGVPAPSEADARAGPVVVEREGVYLIHLPSVFEGANAPRRRT